MSSWNTEQLVPDDKRYVWHPFTVMGDWCAPEHEPILLVEGKGVIATNSPAIDLVAEISQASLLEPVVPSFYSDNGSIIEAVLPIFSQYWKVTGLEARGAYCFPR